MISRLVCWWKGHVWMWKRNIYGDEINMRNGHRSLWVCVLCGVGKTKPELFVEQETP